MGIMTSYASYNDVDQPILGPSCKVAFGNSAFSFFSGFAVFSVVGYLQHIGSPVADGVVERIDAPEVAGRSVRETPAGLCGHGSAATARSVGRRDARQRQVHANDADTDNEAAKTLLQLDLPSKAEVGGQQKNDADHAEYKGK